MRASRVWKSQPLQFSQFFQTGEKKPTSSNTSLCGISWTAKMEGKQRKMGEFPHTLYKK
jgi:hypothetical protein